MFDPPKLPKIKGSMHPRFEEILTPEALAFVAKLDGAHSGRRAELLAARRERGKLISAAKVWMADFEDATSPSWTNVIDGQINLKDAIRGELEFTSEDGKEYKVGEVTPT